jgi:hypothetical protein
MTVVDSETPTQSSASGHVFLVYASLLSKLSPCSLFPAGLSVLYVFLFLVAFFAFAPLVIFGFSRHGGSEPCVERRFREIRTDGVEKR